MSKKKIPELMKCVSGAGGEISGRGTVMHNYMLNRIIMDCIDMGWEPRDIDNYVQDLGWPPCLGQNVKNGANILKYHKPTWDGYMESKFLPADTMFSFKSGGFAYTGNASIIEKEERPVEVANQINFFNCAKPLNDWPILLRDLRVFRDDDIDKGRITTFDGDGNCPIVDIHPCSEYYNLLYDDYEGNLIDAPGLNNGAKVSGSESMLLVSINNPLYLTIAHKDNPIMLRAQSIAEIKENKPPEFYKVLHVKDNWDRSDCDHVFIKVRQDLGPNPNSHYSYLGRLVLIRDCGISEQNRIMLIVHYNINHDLSLSLDHSKFCSPILRPTQGIAHKQEYRNKIKIKLGAKPKSRDEINKEFDFLMERIHKQANGKHYPGIDYFAGQKLITGTPKRLFDPFINAY